MYDVTIIIIFYYFCVGFALDFIINPNTNENVAPGHRRYTDSMKQFAQSLYFYSPKAYNFLHQSFKLPNPRTLRKWLSSVN